MGRIRRRIKQDPWGTTMVACWIGAAILGVAALLLFLTGPDESPQASSSRPTPADGFDPRIDATPTPTSPTDPAAAPLTTNSAFGFGSSGAPFGGSGYTGENRSLRLTVQVTSTEPLGVVGYIIPTSSDRSYGAPTVKGNTFSLSTDVYGEPAYARVFVQAGYSGAAITCTISVDGKVTDTRTVSGRYSQAMCQG